MIIKIKHKVFTLLIFLFILFSSGIQAQDIKSTNEKLQTDTTNIIIQSATGCENAQHAQGINDKTICNPNLKEDFSDVFAGRYILWDNLIIYLVVIGIIISILIKIKMAANGEKTQSITLALGSAVTILLLYPLPLETNKRVTPQGEYYISIVEKFYWKLQADSGKEANATLKEYNEGRLIYFPDIYIPQYEKMTADFEILIDYLNRANALGKYNELTFNVDEFKGTLRAKSQAGKFSANIIIPIDRECVKTAERYGLVDCKAMQIESQKKYLTEAIQLAQAGSINFLKQYREGDFFTNGFDMEMSCDGIEKIDLSDYSDRDMSSAYLKKLASCASRIYLQNIHKFKNITTDDYLENKNFLKSRRVVLCNHDTSGTFKQNGYTKEEMIKKVESCITEACGDSGSPYFCSAAVSLYGSLKQEKVYEWRNIPAIIFGDLFTNATANAETYGSNFSIEYEELEDEFLVTKNSKSVFSIVLKSTSGEKVLESSYWERIVDWASDKWQAVFGIDFDLSIDQFNLLGYMGEDGFWGTERLGTCLQNPKTYQDGWLCGTVLQEIVFNGARNVKGGFSTIMSAMAHISKAKGTSQSTAAEKRQLGNNIARAVNAKNLGVISYLTASSIQTNVYDETSMNVTNAVSANALAVAAALGGKQVQESLKIYGYSEIAYGILMYFVIPMLLIYTFLTLFIEWLYNLIIHLLLLYHSIKESLSSTGSVNNSFSRSDLDTPDWVVNLFIGILIPTLTVIGAGFCIIYIDYIFAAIPIDIFNLTNIISFGYMVDTSEASVFTRVIDKFIGGLLIFLIIKLVIVFCIRLSDYAGWMLFANAQMRTKDSAEEAHNEMQSRIK